MPERGRPDAVQERSVPGEHRFSNHFRYLANPKNGFDTPVVSAEPAGPPRTGPAVLDIGTGAGALVVLAPAGWHRAEIEISPVGTATRTHSQVLGRVANRKRVFAAVFASLAPGDYVVWREAGIGHPAAITEGASPRSIWR